MREVVVFRKEAGRGQGPHRVRPERQEPRKKPRVGLQRCGRGAASRETRLGPEDIPPSVSGDPFSSLVFTSFLGWLDADLAISGA